MRNDPILIFKNSPLEKQDSTAAVLLSFFVFLPLSAALPHSHLLAAGALLLLLLLGCRQPKSKEEFTQKDQKIAKLYLLFWCFSFSALPVAPLPTLLSALLMLAFFLPFFFYGRQELLRRALALLGGVLGAVALLELLSGGGMQGTVDESRFAALARATGPFQNPNALAAFLLPSAAYALSLALFSARRRVLFLLCYLLAGLGVAATFCRGAWLAYLLLSLWLFCRKFEASRIFMAGLAALPLLLLLLPSSIAKRFASLLSPDSSVSYRLSLWQSVFRLSPRPLLFGVGRGTAAMHGLLFPVLAAGLSHVEHLHSLPLEMLVSGGVVGLLLFTLACAACLFRGGTDSIALFSLLVFGLFDTPLYYAQTEVLFWLIMGLCAIGERERGRGF